MSTDGRWRSFPKAPHLLQHVSNGNYYGRIKVGGKVIRESLKTTVWTTAKLRLTDYLKGQQEARGRAAPPRFSEAGALFERDRERDTTIKPRSKEYRRLGLKKIQTSWPGLRVLRLHETTAQVCKEWAAELSKGIASHHYHNTNATLRQVLQTGTKVHKASIGGSLRNPAAELKRVRVRPKEWQLPERSQFKELVENLRTGSGAWGHRVAELVEFLAISV